MKFRCSITINQPKEKVAHYFITPEYQHHFQDGFISKTLISGVEDQKDAQSRLVYKRLELIETIIENNLPDSFLAEYKHKHTTNTMKVTFTKLAHDKTKYNSEIHYTQFNGFMINVLVKLFPSMFKKQVLKWMKQFKTYVETN